ncbi:hypothetical protein KUCAC02_031749, partial [Chaenocephalus aceratus]
DDSGGLDSDSCGLWEEENYSHPTTEAHEPEEIELDSDPVYENFRVTAAHGVKSSQSFPTAAFAPVSDPQISLPETLLMLSLCLAPRATCPRFPALFCDHGSYQLLYQSLLFSWLSFLSVFLWIRKSASRYLSEIEERVDTREECVPDQPEQQEDLQHASVHFSNNRADPLYSNMRAAQPLRHTEKQEVPEYAAVKFSSAAPRTRGQVPEEDPAAFYSIINTYR